MASKKPKRQVITVILKYKIYADDPNEEAVSTAHRKLIEALDKVEAVPARKL